MGKTIERRLENEALAGPRTSSANVAMFMSYADPQTRVKDLSRDDVDQFVEGRFSAINMGQRVQFTTYFNSIYRPSNPLPKRTVLAFLST